MEHEIPLLTGLKLVTVALGAVFLYYTGKAYLKHRERPMLVLFAAVGLMVVAAIAEGFASRILGLPLSTAHIIEAVFTLAGFAVLVASVAWPRRVRDPQA